MGRFSKRPIEVNHVQHARPFQEVAFGQSERVLRVERFLGRVPMLEADDFAVLYVNGGRISIKPLSPNEVQSSGQTT